MGARSRRRKSSSLGCLWLPILAVVGLVLTFLLAHPVLLVVAAVIAALLTVAWIGHSREVKRKALARSLEPAVVDQMSGTQFEHLVADLMSRSGYRHVQVIGGPGDGGVDILAAAADGRPLAVQTKRFLGTVGSPEVRNLIGAVQHEHRGRWPMLVTSGTLTAPAWKVAQAAGVFVVQRDGLGQWMAGTREQLAA
jgi:restriction system protein